MKKYLTLVLLIGKMSLSAHCQLPCGIYHDDLEFAQLEEAVQTLHKANSVISENTASTPISINQSVRAVNLKDEQAKKVSHIISFYFLEQRIKPDQENTSCLVLSAHKIMVLTAKVKSSVDQSIVGQLQAEITSFKTMYQKK